MNTNSLFSFHIPDRMLDDSLLTFCLIDIVNKIKQEDAWKKSSRNAITLVKNAKMKVVLVALHKQAEINFRGSGNILSVQLIEGVLNFKTEKHTALLQKDCLLTCHDCISHSLRAVEESVVLLTILLANVEPGGDNHGFINI